MSPVRIIFLGNSIISPTSRSCVSSQRRWRFSRVGAGPTSSGCPQACEVSRGRRATGVFPAAFEFERFFHAPALLASRRARTGCPRARLAARGAMPRAASLGLFTEGFVAKTCSTPGTAAFWLRALGENSGARRHEALHHGLLDCWRRAETRGCRGSRGTERGPARRRRGAAKVRSSRRSARSRHAAPGAPDGLNSPPHRSSAGSARSQAPVSSHRGGAFLRPWYPPAPCEPQPSTPRGGASRRSRRFASARSCSRRAPASHPNAR
ncbi:hypothetical protein ENSA5_62180 [Enhygromyxa salina]|uniref:Uncharacterized protein n=1 Tax=Enhygromyxa salina TaxID=215803 RepID=A0A2S9XD33_9BACT|nr:hypothetical protein ENSA5_62180 [Enhygromyxa salina]